MFSKAVFPGKYIQGAGAVRELPALVNLFGTRGLLLASPSVASRVLPACGIDWGGRQAPVEVFCGECCERELQRLAAAAALTQADVLVGMGGGKTIDTAKIAADRAGLPVIVVPTIASTDAPCSGCAVLYSEDGIFDSVCYQRANPAAVLVDLEIIAAAPARFLVSGMGDALSTWFEARSCERTGAPNECGGRGTAAGYALARLCYETLLEYGVAAKGDTENHLVTLAVERIVEANTLLSGVGFESAGLATAHAIHNGLTALAETHAFYHGEKVAFGVLVGLQLTCAPAEELAAVYSFCANVGLPTTLAAVGLELAKHSDLQLVAEKACAPEQPIHHEAGEIMPAVVLEAIYAADEFGRRRMGATS